MSERTGFCTISYSFSHCSVLLEQDIFANIGPELFQDIGGTGDDELRGPVLRCLDYATFLGRVVQVGHACFKSVTADLRGIEFFSPSVVLGDEDAGQSIAGPAEKTVLAERVIARIFMGQRGNDGFREIGSRNLVGEGPPIVPAKTCGSAAQFGVGVGAQAVRGEDAGDDEGGIIEAVMQGKYEFLVRGEPRKLGIWVHGAEVWHNAEDAVRLLEI